MSNNVIVFPGKRPTKPSDNPEQGKVDDVKQLIDDDLRSQLLDECRRKHGFTEQKREH